MRSKSAESPATCMLFNITDVIFQRRMSGNTDPRLRAAYGKTIISAETATHPFSASDKADSVNNHGLLQRFSLISNQCASRPVASKRVFDWLLVGGCFENSSRVQAPRPSHSAEHHTPAVDAARVWNTKFRRISFELHATCLAFPFRRTLGVACGAENRASVDQNISILTEQIRFYNFRNPHFCAEPRSEKKP